MLIFPFASLLEFLAPIPECPRRWRQEKEIPQRELTAITTKDRLCLPFHAAAPIQRHGHACTQCLEKVVEYLQGGQVQQVHKNRSILFEMPIAEYLG